MDDQTKQWIEAIKSTISVSKLEDKKGFFSTTRRYSDTVSVYTNSDRWIPVFEQIEHAVTPRIVARETDRDVLVTFYLVNVNEGPEPYVLSASIQLDHPDVEMRHTANGKAYAKHRWNRIMDSLQFIPEIIDHVPSRLRREVVKQIV